MYQLIWSATAQSSYEQIWDFILQKWTVETVIDLDDKVQNLLEQLSRHEHLCPALEEFPNLRKCVISKQTSLVYAVDTEQKIISIVAFVDNRAKHQF